MDAIASAIRLLTDNGYVVLKAPTWPEHLPVEAVRAAPVPARTTPLASGSHSQEVLSEAREFMSVKQFCSPFSNGRSTVYAHIVLVHGGGLSGARYETTPDGREGWATHMMMQDKNTCRSPTSSLAGCRAR
jgi:hypothetical protein